MYTDFRCYFGISHDFRCHFAADVFMGFVLCLFLFLLFSLLASQIFPWDADFCLLSLWFTRCVFLQDLAPVTCMVFLTKPGKRE